MIIKHSQGKLFHNIHKCTEPIWMKSRALYVLWRMVALRTSRHCYRIYATKFATGWTRNLCSTCYLMKGEKQQRNPTEQTAGIKEIKPQNIGIYSFVIVAKCFALIVTNKSTWKATSLIADVFSFQWTCHLQLLKSTIFFKVSHCAINKEMDLQAKYLVRH